MSLENLCWLSKTLANLLSSAIDKPLWTHTLANDEFCIDAKDMV